MKKIDGRKKREPNKILCSLPSFKLKRYYPELAAMSNEERVEHYLKIREQKFSQIKKYASKSVSITRNKIAPVDQFKADQVICSDSDLKVDGALANKIHAMEESKDRLVIELSDYLALNKNKNIAKFKLEPISSKSDKVNPPIPVEHVIKTANTVQLNQNLKGKQLNKTKLNDLNEESRRTFLLVPQNANNSANKRSKVRQKKVIRKKSKILLSSESNSPVKTFKKIGQNDHEKSNSQSLNIIKNCKSAPIKIIDQQESKSQAPEKESRPVIKVTKKVQNNIRHSDTNEGNLAALSSKLFAQEKKKKLNVVLRTHPYFSMQKPFIIKHKPGSSKVIELQNYYVTNHQENLLNSETNLDSVFEHSKLIDEIQSSESTKQDLNFTDKNVNFELLQGRESTEQDLNFELLQGSESTEQDVNFEFLQCNESIDQIFPVALKTSDSDDFEYLGFETSNEISTESEMQILGI